MTEQDDDDLSKKGPGPLRKVLVVGAVLACAGFWLWTRYGVTKQPLGGPCTWAIDCAKDAPRCMRPDIDEPGICSRACVPPDDCAPGIRCVEVELDAKDDKGNYVKEGTCVPQTFLDARKAKARGDAGIPKGESADSWVEVSETESPIEGEIVLRRAGAEKTFLVKGALVRTAESEAGPRKVIDTSSLRVFTLDDKKRSYTATVLGGRAASDEVTVTKTGKKERVADRECELWELLDKRGKHIACVVSGGAFVDPNAASVPPWMQELAVRTALPLRVVELDAKGHETTRAEVTRFSPRRLDRSLFLVPKSYKNAGR